jgi:hypothetical protein
MSTRRSAIIGATAILGAQACNLILGNEDRHLARDAGTGGAGLEDGATGMAGAAAGSVATGGASGGASGMGASAGKGGGSGAAGTAGSGTGGRGGSAGAGDASTGGVGGVATGGGAGAGGAAGGASPDGSAGSAGSPTTGSGGGGGSAGSATGGSSGQGGSPTDGAAGTSDVDAAADAKIVCTSRTADPSTGVFVVASGGVDASTCGDRQKPCQSIAAGIEQARALRVANVYVARGLYVEEIFLAPGIRVEGAWAVVGETWSPICADTSPKPNDAVTIKAPDTKNVTVRADALGGTATLAWLTIRSKDSASPSESLYGVWANGADTHLMMDNVDVIVAKGGDGAIGVPGVPGTGGSPLGCDVVGDGANGQMAGAPGVGAPIGTFSANGYTAPSGFAGSDGQPGHNGSVSMIPPRCVACYTGCSVGRYSCEPTTPAPSSCGQPGKAGCGGTEGKAGNGAAGGGSSIALYLWDATVSVEGGKLQSDAGGTGAAGGVGGSGGLGAIGAEGKQGDACDIGCSWDDALGCQPGTRIGGPGGAPGGKGGDGTKGGDGGGGAGGFSFAIYQGGSGKATTSSTELVFGSAGLSQGNGEPGRAAKIGPVP